MVFRTQQYVSGHSHVEGGKIKKWNANFWNVINGVKPSNKYFIGKGFEDEEMFVAALRLHTEESDINIEKAKKSETIHFYCNPLWHLLPPLGTWINKKRAAIAFLRLKHKYKLSEEDITAFRVAEKLSGTSNPPSEAD